MTFTNGTILTNGACADDCCSEPEHGNSSRQLELKRGGFIASYPPFESLQPRGSDGFAFTLSRYPAL